MGPDVKEWSDVDPIWIRCRSKVDLDMITRMSDGDQIKMWINCESHVDQM